MTQLALLLSQRVFLSHLVSIAQESEDIPRDFTKLFTQELFQVGNSMVPHVVHAYKELEVKHEQLKLIEPNFETPLPPLRPAVFPPTFRELGPPALDLFDLDDCFSSEQVRLNQLTNKCALTLSRRAEEKKDKLMSLVGQSHVSARCRCISYVLKTVTKVSNVSCTFYMFYETRTPNYHVRDSDVCCTPSSLFFLCTHTRSLSSPPLIFPSISTFQPWAFASLPTCPRSLFPLPLLPGEWGLCVCGQAYCCVLWDMSVDARIVLP